MTTWTTDLVPPRPAPRPEQPAPLPRTPWDCANCALLNDGPRRRCRECGTRRDP